MKSVDVIIPVYKAKETIIRTLGSIITQSIVAEIKVTMVNDADGLDYSDIINHFSPYVEIQEIKLETNGGPGVARQKGLESTSLPYVTFIDADDTFAGAFAIETLKRAIDDKQDYHTAVGSFLEDSGQFKFIPHQNDLVWMFGKLYKRSFLQKYKIGFNETRANEDNGFNTIVRLCSNEQEKIMFLPDIVYYWHYKSDSITRINNAEYSYNQSFPGYTTNMIYAIKHAKQMVPFNSYVDIWTIQVMAQLYLYYLQTVKRDSRFSQQNYNSCVEYYKEVYGDLDKRIPKEFSNQIFAQVFAEQAQNNKDIVPELTIRQFIDRLKESTEKGE